MKHLVLIVLLIAVGGCATTTLVTMPCGDIYQVKSKSDALVEFTDGNKKIVVDNRGRPGIIEQSLGIMFMNLPDVEIKP